MSFYTPITQFSSPAFVFGYALGAGLNSSLFGGSPAFNCGNFGYTTSLFSTFPSFGSFGNFGFNNVFSFNQNFSFNTSGGSSFFGNWALAPNFNSGYWNTGSFWNTGSLVNKKTSTKPKVNMSISTETDISGYNAEKGAKLAKDALEHSPGEFTHYCARHVSNALERTGLNTNMQRANGYKMADELRKNPNFKEISVNSVDWKHLPAGCILVFNPGTHKNYDPKWGHIEISTGKGTAVSDGITHNILRPDTIFIPV